MASDSLLFWFTRLVKNFFIKKLHHLLLGIRYYYYICTN